MKTTQEILNQVNDIAYSWDAKYAFCKANRFKLTTCFSGDVFALTEYKKYIGRDYLTIRFSDYDDSIYSVNRMNTIEFIWGDYKRHTIFNQVLGINM